MSGSEEERRPRPIGVADESEEGDSDVERNDAAPAPAPQAEMTTPEETAAKKPSRKLPAFSENDLAKEKGLWRIYKEFPQKCRYKGKGREVLCMLLYGQSRVVFSSSSSKFEIPV